MPHFNQCKNFKFLLLLITGSVLVPVQGADAGLAGFKTKSELKKKIESLEREYESYRTEMDQRMDVLLDKIQKDQKKHINEIERIRKKHTTEITRLQESLLSGKKEPVGITSHLLQLQNSLAIELRQWVENGNIQIGVNRQEVFLRFSAISETPDTHSVSKDTLEMIRQTSYISGKTPGMEVILEWVFSQPRHPSRRLWLSASRRVRIYLEIFWKKKIGDSIDYKTLVSWQPKKGTAGGLVIHLREKTP